MSVILNPEEPQLSVEFMSGAILVKVLVFTLSSVKLLCFFAVSLASLAILLET